MVTEQNLRDIIDSNIINNDNFLITPGKLRQVLVSHIDWANQNISAALQGVAITSTNPGPSHIQGRWWWAQTSGSAQTFTNFGLSTAANEFALFLDNGTTYIKITVPDRYTNIADTVQGNNLFNGVTELGLWNITTGVDQAGVASWVRTQKIPVLPNQTYAIAGYGSRHDVVGYKSALGATYDQTFVTTPVTGGYTFTTGANTTFVAFNISNTGENLVTLAGTFQLNVGATVLAYSPANQFFYNIKETSLPNYYNKQAIDAMIDDVNNDINDIATVEEFALGTNLLNIANRVIGSRVKADGQIETGLGTQHAYVSIPHVVTGKKYWISGWGQSTKYFRFADADGNVITVETLSSYPQSVIAPYGAATLDITVLVNTDPNTTHYGTFMVNEGYEASTFAGYIGELRVVEVQHKKVMAVNGENSPLRTEMTDAVTVIVRDNEVFVRTKYSPVEDLVHLMNLSNQMNETVGFVDVKKIPYETPDDIVAWADADVLHTTRGDEQFIHFDGLGKLGGAHGMLVRGARYNGGKDQTDYGSTWLETVSNRQYKLVSVSGSQATFISVPYTNGNGVDEMTVADIVPGRTLTHVSGATHTANISIVSSIQDYEWPYVVNGGQARVMIDGVVINDNGTYKGRSIQIVDTYEIFNTAEAVSNFPIGSIFAPYYGNAMCRTRIVYDFKLNSCLMVDTVVDMLQANKRIHRAAFVTASPLDMLNASKLWFYAPRNTSNLGYKLYAREDLTTPPSADLVYDGVTQTDPHRPIDFVAEYTTDNSNRPLDGFAHGVSETSGYSAAYTGPRNGIPTAWTIYTDNTSEPVVIHDTNVTTGDTFHVVGFRQYYWPNKNKFCTAVFHNQQGRYVMGYVILHQDVRQLPVVFHDTNIAGMLIDAYDIDGDVSDSLSTEEIIPASGITVKATANSISTPYHYFKLQLLK